MIDIKQGPLGTFEKDRFTSFPCIIEENFGFLHIGFEWSECFEHPATDFRNICLDRRSLIELFQALRKLLGELIRTGISKSQTNAIHLVSIGRPDSLSRCANLFAIWLPIEVLMYRKDQMRAIRNQNSLWRNVISSRSHSCNFLIECKWINYHTVAQNTNCIWTKNSAWNRI